MGEVRTEHFAQGRPARTVRLFLTEGTPHGIVVADVGNWNGKALAAPRGRLPDLLRRPEASRTGVYVLLGPDPERADQLCAYIGEADDIAARMRIHLRSEAKEFFDRVVLLVSSDETLTKGHVRYLESRLITMALQAGSVTLTNDTSPDFQRLPEADRADMDAFVDIAAMVLPILGCDLFRGRTVPRSITGGEPAQSSTETSGQESVFQFMTGGAAATAVETEEGFVVRAGSTARRTATATFPAGYQALRAKLVADGLLADAPSPELLVFTADVSFSSPSAAASIVAARSASGPIEWKLKGQGASYRDWRERLLE